ncbi:hypothetical protein ACFVIM_17670 [Streptomyces sp. NPDC057638]|uniref:hypothetical protein n=1 Tax=Streptomyces sp. NPDC057638 TaxID=3346190 RepID=UPI0036C059B0
MRGGRVRAVVAVAAVAGLLSGCGEDAAPEKRSATTAPATADGRAPATVSPPVAAPLTAALAARALPTLVVPGLPKETHRAVEPADFLCPGASPAVDPLDSWCEGLLHGGTAVWAKHSPEQGEGWSVGLTVRAYRDAAAARASYTTERTGSASDRTVRSVPATALGDERARFHGQGSLGARDSLLIRSGTVVIRLEVNGPVAPEITGRIPGYGAAAVAAAQRAQTDALAAGATTKG